MDIDTDFVQIKSVCMLRIVAAFVQKESGDKRYGLRRAESIIFISRTRLAGIFRRSCMERIEEEGGGN